MADKNGWPKYDPNRGIWLCEPCWNLQHYGHERIKGKGRPTGKYCKCHRGKCECPCEELMKPSRRPKFTGDGQTTISMKDAINIDPLS